MILSFIGGVVIGLAPFVIWFASHGALGDMIYGTFTYNFAYLESAGADKGMHAYLTFFATLVPSVALIVLSFILLRRPGNRNKPVYLTTLILGVITIYVLTRGTDYRHYFIMSLPADFMALAIATRFNKKIKCLVSLLILVPLPPSYGYLARQYHKLADCGFSNYDKNWIDPLSKVVYDNVPVEDYDSIYLVPLERYYSFPTLVEQGHYPVGTFFFCQNTMCANSKEMAHRVTDAFVKANPKWILTELPIDKLQFIPNPHDYDLFVHQPMPSCNARLYKRRASDE